MLWHKLGHLFVADNLCDELQTHASNPTAIRLNGDLFRVYYSARDVRQRSSVSYIDLNVNGMSVTIVGYAKKPVLTPGSIGMFDDSGVTVSCVMREKNQFWLYYMGWNLAVTVPFRNAIGLATSYDGETFVRVQQAPVLDRNKVDLLTLSYPWIIKNKDGWQMWYGSSVQCKQNTQKSQHVIRYADSSNGIDWNPNPDIALNVIDSRETGLSRPYTQFENGIYKMWYCYRGDQYRLGYAESVNGKKFVRKDQNIMFDGRHMDWDNLAQAYPNIFHHKGYSYLLYNGNNYGKTGFGIAVARQEAA